MALFPLGGQIPTAGLRATKLGYLEPRRNTFFYAGLRAGTFAYALLLSSDYFTFNLVIRLLARPRHSPLEAAMTTSHSPLSAAPVIRSLAIRERAFLAWRDQARPGDRLVYHQGHLGADRAAGSALPEALRRELGRIADRAMALARAGHLQLVQQRRGADMTAYLAVMGSAG